MDTETQRFGLILQNITPNTGVPTRVDGLPAVETVDSLGDLQKTLGPVAIVRGVEG